MQQENNRTYQVIEKIRQTADVVTVRFLPIDAPIPTYVPGQYIVAYMADSDTPQGKAYSISSAPDEPYMAITVKAIGPFSNYLSSLEPGGSFLGSDPYGFFYSESEESPLVMIAAGIGIAPFRSMIFDIASRNPLRPVHLFESSRTVEDVCFRAELDGLLARFPGFQATRFVTRQTDLPTGFSEGRITAQRVVDGLPEVPGREFLLCGSISFTRDIWRGLRACGVPEEQILTEAFFSH
jgi:ferredoxin-NADP reductase